MRPKQVYQGLKALLMTDDDDHDDQDDDKDRIVDEDSNLMR